MNSLRLLLVVGAVVATLGACSGGTPQPGGDADCPPVQVSGPDGQPLDLSGPWSGNDGGVYHIKQIGSCVWWSGLSNFEGQYPGQEWIMAFRGTITSTDANAVITGDFVDVKSSNPGSGTMTIDARNDGGTVNLYRTAATGHGIGVTFWQRTTEPTPTEVPVVRTSPTAAPS